MTLVMMCRWGASGGRIGEAGGTRGRRRRCERTGRLEKMMGGLEGDEKEEEI